MPGQEMGGGGETAVLMITVKIPYFADVTEPHDPVDTLKGLCS